jgi:hypothetical protein
VLAFDRAQQIDPGAEVISRRRIIALAGRFADLPVRHRIHSALGEQPLSSGQDHFSGTRGRERTARISTVESVVILPKTIDLGGHCPTGRTERL